MPLTQITPAPRTRGNTPKLNQLSAKDSLSVPTMMDNGKKRTSISQTADVYQYQDTASNGLQLISPVISNGLMQSFSAGGLTPLDQNNISQFYQYVEQTHGFAGVTPNYDQYQALDPSKLFEPATVKPTQTMSMPTSPKNHPHKLTIAQKEALSQLSTMSESNNGSQPGTPNSNGNKRQLHIISEQRRRQEIKSGFDTLRMEIPHLVHKKVSKTTLLNEAINYVRQVKHERDGLAMEVERLHQLTGHQL